MKLVFDDQAIADLENIFGWIAQDNPVAARSVTDRLFSSIELLISFPLIGHVGRDPDTFEWAVPRLPYVVVYEVYRGAGANCCNGCISRRAGSRGWKPVGYTGCTHEKASGKMRDKLELIGSGTG